MTHSILAPPTCPCPLTSQVGLQEHGGVQSLQAALQAVFSAVISDACQRTGCIQLSAVCLTPLHGVCHTSASPAAVTAGERADDRSTGSGTNTAVTLGDSGTARQGTVNQPQQQQQQIARLVDALVQVCSDQLQLQAAVDGVDAGVGDSNEQHQAEGGVGEGSHDVGVQRRQLGLLEGRVLVQLLGDVGALADGRVVPLEDEEAQLQRPRWVGGSLRITKFMTRICTVGGEYQ